LREVPREKHCFKFQNLKQTVENELNEDFTLDHGRGK